MNFNLKKFKEDFLKYGQYKNRTIIKVINYCVTKKNSFSEKEITKYIKWRFNKRPKAVQRDLKYLLNIKFINKNKNNIFKLNPKFIPKNQKENLTK